MFFVPYGITLGTPVTKAPVEIVDGVGDEIETVDGEASGGHAILAAIAYVLNEITLIGIRMVEQLLLQDLLAPLVIAPG